MMQLLLAVLVFVVAASAQQPCNNCGSFCACVNRIRTAGGVSMDAIDKAYTACDPEMGQMTGAGPDPFLQYIECLRPSCPGCRAKVSQIMGLPAARKRRSVRAKRQAFPDMTQEQMDKIDQCVSQKLGVSIDQVFAAEEQFDEAMDAGIDCYSRSCGYNDQQMEQQDKACMKKYGITEEDFEDYGDSDMGPPPGRK